eukprot:15341958-Ditylum_brightwellii.AAC.1
MTTILGKEKDENKRVQAFIEQSQVAGEVISSNIVENIMDKYAEKNDFEVLANKNSEQVTNVPTSNSSGNVVMEFESIDMEGNDENKTTQADKNNDDVDNNDADLSSSTDDESICNSNIEDIEMQTMAVC